MAAVLIALRDALIAMALAWVGVSFEQRTADTGCANNACQAEQGR